MTDTLNHRERNPMNMLKLLTEGMLTNGIYRIQRSPFRLYPENPHALKNSEEQLFHNQLLFSFYDLFEHLWIEEYDTNPYRFLTEGRIEYGKDSELAVAYNTVTGVAHISYSIRPSDDDYPVLTYPISMAVDIDHNDITKNHRPIEIALRDLISRADAYNLKEVNRDVINEISDHLPATKTTWFLFKEQLITQLSTEQLSVIEGASQWKEAVRDDHLTVTLCDHEQEGYPSITLFEGDPVGQNRAYLNQVVVVMPSPMFSFARPDYEPFTDPPV